MNIWYNHNGLNINEEKTELIIIQSEKIRKINKRDKISIKIRNTEVIEKKEIKYLGIIIDQNLKWTQQINQIKEKMRKLKYTIRKIKNIKMSDSIRKTIYYNIIESKITYGIEIWGNTGRGKINKLQKIQDQMIALVFGSRKNISNIKKDMKIMNCQQIIAEKLIKKSWNILNKTETKRGKITLNEKPIEGLREMRKTTKEYLKDKKQNNNWGKWRPQTKMIKIINKLVQLNIIEKEEIEF